MLVLSRQIDEKVIIYRENNGNIDIIATITLVDIRGDKARLGFEADKSITIHREEVFNKVTNDN